MIWVALGAVVIVGCLYEPEQPIEDIMRWALRVAPIWQEDD